MSLFRKRKKEKQGLVRLQIDSDTVDVEKILREIREITGSAELVSIHCSGCGTEVTLEQAKRGCPKCGRKP